MKKKGITLIETVIVLAIAFLLMITVENIFISYIKSYKNTILQNKGFNYLNEAILIIDKEVNFNSNNVVTDGNVIRIDYSDGTTVNNIKYINGSIYVLYGTKFSLPKNSSPKNIIIDQVKSFTAIRLGRTIYVEIVWYTGQRIERCLSIENAN